MTHKLITVSSSWKSVMLFLFMSAGIALAGMVFYLQQKNYVAADKHQDLKNLNHLTTVELENWWQETHLDLQLIASNLVLAEEIVQVRSSSLKPALRDALLDRISGYIKSREYRRIGFFDPDGHIIACYPDSIHPAPSLVMRAFSADSILSSDLYRMPDGTPSLQMASPVVEHINSKPILLGVLILEVDPAIRIYPLLNSISMEASSIEALIARREGDSVLYMSPMRFDDIPPLTRRVPVSGNTIVAQATRGRYVLSGVDYRGKPVFAHASRVSIPGWYLVVKMDEQEVFLSLQKISWLTGLIVFSLVIAAGAGIGMYAKQQAARSYRQQLQDELDRKALVRHYEYLTKYAYDMIVLLDGHAQIVELNEAALASFGYSEEGIKQTSFDRLCSDELKRRMDEKLAVRNPAGIVLEGWFRRKNGEEFCGEMGMRPIEIEGSQYLQAVIRDISERRRAEGNLRENEARLRILVSNYPGIISLVDRNGIVKLSEGRCLKEIGIEPEASIGKSIFDSYASIPSVTSSIQAALVGEESRSIQTLQGLSFETQFLPYRDETGSILGVLSLSDNITERLQIEDRLRRTEVRLHSLFNNMNEGVALHRVLYDDQGIANNYMIFDINPQYESILGTKREAVLNKPATEVYGVDVPPYLKEFLSVADTGKPYHFETYFSPMDKHFYVSVASLGRGQFATIFIDISERRKMEAQLRENEQKFRVLFETIEQGVVYQDRNGAILSANPAAERILGLTFEQMTGRTSMDPRWRTIRPDGSELSGDEHPSMIAVRTGKPQRGVCLGVFHPQQEKHRWVIVDAVPIIKENETIPEQTYAFFVDITESKEAEAKILALNSELIEKNKELEQIVYITSHDLRSPLVNIEGFSKEMNRELQDFADAVRHEQDPEVIRLRLAEMRKEASSSFGYIFASTAKMDQLLAGLLKISRLGRVIITPKQVDMNHLVESVVDTMEYRHQKLGAKINVAPLPNCSADDLLLNQVFSNVLDNALKFLVPGRPGLITIDGNDDGVEVTYRIADNGTGIAPEFQQQIFELFRRLDISKPGDGLGLTICTKILQRLNGNIRLTSTPGAGTTFHITLPSL